MLHQRIHVITEKSTNPLTLNHVSHRLDLGVDEGNCQYYIKRKKRFCSHRCIAGNKSGFCTEHTNAGLEESRKQNDDSRRRYECREVLRRVIDDAIGKDSIDDSTTLAKQENCSFLDKKHSHKRISAKKRMANPFSLDLTPDIGDPNWGDIFSNISLPIHIDVGCARGRCIERISKRFESPSLRCLVNGNIEKNDCIASCCRDERCRWNHLGLEIRADVVRAASERLLRSNSEGSIANDVDEEDSHDFIDDDSSLDSEISESKNISMNYNGSTTRSCLKRQRDQFEPNSAHEATGHLNPISSSNVPIVSLISNSNVDEATSTSTSKRRNLYYLACNFAASADKLLASLPPGLVKLISFQFPDPWRRLKHKKRLIIQPKLVRILGKHLHGGSLIYLSTDCDDIMASMKQVFLTTCAIDPTDSCDIVPSTPCNNVSNDCSEKPKIEKAQPLFELVPAAEIISNLIEESHQGTIAPNTFIKSPTATMHSVSIDDCWLPLNPLDEPSERELVCEVDWRRVWRCVFRKC